MYVLWFVCLGFVSLPEWQYSKTTGAIGWERTPVLDRRDVCHPWFLADFDTYQAFMDGGQSKLSIQDS